MGSKAKDIRKGKGGAWRKYCSVTHGNIGFLRVLRNELIVLFFSKVPGALGMILRKIFYPCMFRSCGKKVVFGCDLSLRHAAKIDLGAGVVLDDGVMLDAKGEDNHGITLDSGVFVGRFTKVYCKNGDIHLHENANLSSNCTLYSNNRLTIGRGCMIGAYTYILSGGEYDPLDLLPYCEQNGMNTRGPLVIGDDCWIGARVTILDSAQTIGRRALIAASALVNKPVADFELVAGVPAKPIKNFGTPPSKQ